MSIRETLQQTIARQGPIDFSTFTEISLHDPLDGYYGGGAVNISTHDDHHFVTAPLLSPNFGATLANTVEYVWDDLGRPDSMDVVEIGAGTGQMAYDTLHAVRFHKPGLESKIKYTIVERSQALRDRQQQKLYAFPHVTWAKGDAFQPNTGAVRGLIISNELPDAFGMNRLTRRCGELFEIFTGVAADGSFVDVLGPPSAHNLILPEAQDVREMREKLASPLAKVWLDSMGEILKEGYLVTIDYGYEDRHLAYKGQYIRTYGDWKPAKARSIGEAYRLPGEVDITGNVNFTSFKLLGAAAGLETVYYRHQVEFLRRFGYHALHAAKPRGYDGDSVIDRSVFKNFYALVQRKVRV
ncbi:MAG TPA: SAM-dependent methyltransferase [Candidatus Saccharimonadales bacterium]|nr:SAM-dependent methyltransferase [Candidatus Saccharimonadales bacterium]